MKKLLLPAFFVVLFLAVGLLFSCGSKKIMAELPPWQTPPPAGDIWIDSVSGLTWQVSPTGGTMNWRAAKSHCENLGLGGWRLPTISELRSLIRGCLATQKGGACGVTDSCLSRKNCQSSVCDGCSSKGGPGPGGAYWPPNWPPEISGDVSWYWSSSEIPDNDFVLIGLEAWTVHFYGGDVRDHFTGDDYYLARCVR